MTTRRACALACALLAAASAMGAAALRAQATTAPAPAAGKRSAGRVVAGVVRSIERTARARERHKATAVYDPIFRKYTKRYFGVATDWRWFKAQGMAESDLVPTARSRVGARGIMQLMPSTFAAIQSQRREFSRIDDPEWNIAAGIAHDRYLWKLWEDRVHEPDERWEFMFASYNAGQGTIYRAQRAADSLKLNRACWKDIEQVAPTTTRWRYTETLGYVRKIRANKAALPER